MKSWALAVMGLATFAAATQAATAPPKKKAPAAKVREKAQHDRIRDGMHDHSLTPGEAARLRQEQKRIHDLAADLASDGVITPAERAKLDAAQDAASRHIAKERHDRQGLAGPKPNWRVWGPAVQRHRLTHYLRIIQGFKAGSLTAEEAGELAVLEASIGQMEQEMKSDGVLTAEERSQLQAALKAAGEEIFELKGNEATRPRLALVALVNSGRFTRADARELLSQLGRIFELARLLGGPALAAEARAALEAEFAALASQLFE